MFWWIILYVDLFTNFSYGFSLSIVFDFLFTEPHRYKWWAALSLSYYWNLELCVPFTQFFFHIYTYFNSNAFSNKILSVLWIPENLELSSAILCTISTIFVSLLISFNFAENIRHIRSIVIIKQHINHILYKKICPDQFPSSSVKFAYCIRLFANIHLCRFGAYVFVQTAKFNHNEKWMRLIIFCFVFQFR